MSPKKQPKNNHIGNTGKSQQKGKEPHRPINKNYGRTIQRRKGQEPHYR